MKDNMNIIVGISSNYFWHAELNALWQLCAPALGETLYMLVWSGTFAALLGLTLGVLLYMTSDRHLWYRPAFNRMLGTLVNVLRSIPFVILIIAVFPLAKLVVGTTIGATAAIVPLTVAAAPFAARMVEASLRELDPGTIEAALAMGASPWQIIWRVLLPETAATLCSGITTLFISILGYSAMAGAIGGGGLGDIAIRYGYQKFRSDVLFFAIILLIALVQIMQFIGGRIARKLDHR